MTSPYQFTNVVDGRVIVDENSLDLDYRPPFTVKPWQPVKPVTPYDKLRVMEIDIETSGLDSNTDRIYAIGIYDRGVHHIWMDKSERRILNDCMAFLKNNKPQIFVGHNHIGFDLPFIIKRCERFNVACPFTQNPPEYVSRITSASVNGKPIEFLAINYPGVSIVDTYHQAGVYDKTYACFQNYRLKDVAIHIGARDERRLELDVHQINELWHAENWDPIKEYLRYDLEDTKALADFFIPQVYYQRSVVPLKTQQLATVSPARKWQAILEKYYDSTPDADDRLKYDGAYCEVSPGLYRNCFKIDVSSMYPSIQLLYGICSLKDIQHHYLSVLDYLRTERYKLKRAGKDAQQNAYKILINGGYGFSGTGGYGYNCYQTAALVTAYGRKLIRLMMDVSRAHGGHIIEVDTDGIILAGDAQEIFEAVSEALPDGIEIDLDWTGMDVYAPKIKNYLLINPATGKITSKGVFRKRNRSQLQKEFPIQYILNYLESKDKAQEYYSDIVEKLSARRVPLTFITNTERIRKGDKMLTGVGLGREGDKVTYYLSERRRYHKRTGKQIKSERLPVSLASGVDYWIDYYVNIVNTLKKEIDEVITDDN